MTGEDKDGKIKGEIDQNFPRGCYVNSGAVFFNNHPIGAKERKSAPICRNSKLQLLISFGMASNFHVSSDQ